MLFTRKRSLSLDSFDSEKPMAKRARRQVLPQSSPVPAPTKVDSLDKSRSLTPSPLSTTTSSSSPASPPSQCSNKPESSLSASPSSSFDSLSSSLSPASLLSSLTPPSSPPTVASVSSPHTVPNALLSSENAEAPPTCSFANDVTADEEARLTARFQDDLRRIWGNLAIMQASIGFYDLIVRLGLWTGTREECVTLTRAHPDLVEIFYRVLDTGDFHEISSHPAFHNPLNRVIDKVIYSVDHIFASIRGGNLPSASFPPTSLNSRSTRHLEDLDGPSAASDMVVAEELMYMKRSYITAISTRKTRLLLQGLLQYWGLYFSFSTTSAQNQAGIPSTSPDLAFALKLLRRLRASAAAAGVDTSHLADKVFYALYLSRILVLYHFLDSLPSDISESQAHREWLYFQLAPPLTSAGVDIFTAVLEGVAGGDVDDLRTVAERRLSALGWRNHQWFSQSLYGSYVEGGFYVDPLEEVHPPLYLVIDEIEMPVSEGLKPRAARRVARKRAEVYSLLCRPDSS